MLSRQFFEKSWLGLCLMYNREAPAELMTLYWNCLHKEMTDEQFDACLQLHIKSRDFGTFFPKPADILRHLEITPKSKALEAWALITGDRHDREIAKQDPIAEKAMRMIGGWNNFAMVKIDDLPFRQRDFVEAYCLVCAKNEREEVFDDVKALGNIMKKVIELKRA